MACLEYCHLGTCCLKSCFEEASWEVGSSEGGQVGMETLACQKLVAVVAEKVVVVAAAVVEMVADLMKD